MAYARVDNYMYGLFPKLHSSASCIMGLTNDDFASYYT